MFLNTNNTVSNNFHLKTDFLMKKRQSGEALASLVAPSPMRPCCQFYISLLECNELYSGKRGVLRWTKYLFLKILTKTVEETGLFRPGHSNMKLEDTLN